MNVILMTSHLMFLKHFLFLMGVGCVFKGTNFFRMWFQANEPLKFTQHAALGGGQLGPFPSVGLRPL